ncbi:hypothetical protein KL86PLE_110064 [uncultured Pleomorphomonas sp.]|uniref:Uncharacterized protein n=1 Tax=uncultured Pleomorphomonas sp. TaxID=442121 RepID=A0A212L7D2_9HYPH|nr:hypothetical protein [uncultured Pleomorphomonas sp.]SCM73430.1 hypothetical protein KL86PLE_110064 [uncultured Pleomorphomonas sp.]
MSIEAYVTKLASEGVPVGCIARAFSMDRGRLKMIIDDALESGLIAEAPAPDWLGTRFDDRPAVGAVVETPPVTREGVLLGRYGLDGRAAKLLLALHDRPFLPADEAIDAFTASGSKGALSNMLTEIRRAVAKDSLCIRARRGAGYFLAIASRNRLGDIFRRAGCE